MIATGGYKMPKYPKITSKEIPYANAPSGKVVYSQKKTIRLKALDCTRMLDGHRCWSQCVEFRFQNNKLKAFDSHFGGGTSMLHGEINEEEKVREVMERVFNKECSNSSWEDNHDEREVKKRVIKIDSDGWLQNA